MLSGEQNELRLRKGKRGHIPLHNRPTEISYEARVAKLSGKKLQRKVCVRVFVCMPPAA